MQDDVFASFAEKIGLRIDTILSPPSWGQGNVRFLKLADGSRLVLKILTDASALYKLPSNVVQELFDYLHAHTHHLCLPQQLGGSYTSSADGRMFMAFPWLGGKSPLEPQWDLSLEEHVDCIATINRELVRLPEGLVRSLRAFGADYPFDLDAFQRELRQTKLFFTDQFQAACADLLTCQTPTSDRDCFTQLTHGDLQTSNILRLSSGELIVLDVDNLSIANVYSDFIYIMAARGASSSEFRNLEEAYRRAFTRDLPPLNVNHLVFAFHVCLGFLANIAMRVEAASLQTGDKLPDLSSDSVDPADLAWLKRLDEACFYSLTTQVPRFRLVLSHLLFERVQELT